MNGILANARIATKLPMAIGGLVALTIVVMSVANALMTHRIISDAAEEKLRGIALLNSQRVEVLYEAIDRDLRLQAANPAVSVALVALADGYNSLDNAEDVLQRVYIEENAHPTGEKDKLVEADTGSSYGFIHAIYHPAFDRLQDEMDYYDIFLFDTAGNLVYSVFKESDFATNMLNGPWSDSGLAEVFRLASALESGDASAFVDFAPYGPSNGAPAAFMARPVFNEQGDRLGVLAYQMPVTQLNGAAGDLQGLGETADGFIVGSDGTLRTDTPKTEASDILSTRVEHPAISSARTGEKILFDDTGFGGQRVIGFAAPIKFFDTTWVVVVQQEHAELYSGLWSALLRALAISAAILAGVVLVSTYFSRSISKPLVSLTAAVTDVADGATETVVPGTDRGDEIGELARKTEIFRQNAKRIEKMVEEQKEAGRKMTALSAEREAASKREIEAAQEKERLEQEVKRQRDDMMRGLGSAFGDVVSAALEGNFSKRVDTRFNDEILDGLSQNINSLMQSVDTGLAKTGEALERVANGDLTHKMTGDFHGAFSDLQNNVNDMIGSLTALIAGMTESGVTLSGSASELRQTADALSRQAEQNAASVEETSAALEQLTASITQVDANLTGVSQNARTAKETAGESERVATEAATSMDRIAKGSAEINRATEVINDIAFQINLLALNAGVEAARAGDAGRGFSVVASEVRQLAQRAGEAVKEIAEVLKESDAAVSEGVTNVANAKTSLDEISRKVISISESVDDVTRAISEQASGIKEISSAVALVDGNTQKQAAAFEEVTASSHVLASEAEELRNATARFQIPNTSVRKVRKTVEEPETIAQSPTMRPAAAIGDANFDNWDEF